MLTSRHTDLLVVVVLAACGSGTPLSTGTPMPIPQTTLAAGCAPDPANPGVEIVACGFAPTLSLIGVDDTAVYVLSEAGAVERVDKTTAARTKLYTFRDSMLTLDPQWNGIRLQGGSLYLSDEVVDGTTAEVDIMAIDAAATTQATPRVVAVASGWSSPVSLVVDSTHAYWESLVTSQDGAYLGPLVAAPLSGGAAQPITTVSPDIGPLGILDGKLYFFYTSDDSSPTTLVRVPVGGGATETVVAGLDPKSNPSTAALGSDAVYVTGKTTSTTKGSVVSILRYPFSGGAAEDLYDSINGGDIVANVPSELTVDGDFVYFVSTTGPDAQLMRMKPDGTGLTALGPSLYAPSFDEHYVYVSYTRGGDDSPIEGVIGRIAK